MKRKAILFCLLLAALTLFLGGCSNALTNALTEPLETDIPGSSASDHDIRNEDLKDIVFQLVSSAENSTLDYMDQYGYIEDIGDGRCYTAGLIGFTSGTGDLLDVIERYTELKPDNDLKAYIPALIEVEGTDSHEGLGDDFVKAWESAAKDDEMIQAQNEIIDEQYLTPAVKAAQEDGLSSLGQYIYFDAMVVHGPGDDEDSFGGIRAAAKEAAATPWDHGDIATYLNAFLDAREKVMLKEEAHSDLSRIEAQRKFVEEGNFTLETPLTWEMYGDTYTIE